MRLVTSRHVSFTEIARTIQREKRMADDLQAVCDSFIGNNERGKESTTISVPKQEGEATSAGPLNKDHTFSPHRFQDLVIFPEAGKQGKAESEYYCQQRKMGLPEPRGFTDIIRMRAILHTMYADEGLAATRPELMFLSSWFDVASSAWRTSRTKKPFHVIYSHLAETGAESCIRDQKNKKAKPWDLMDCASCTWILTLRINNAHEQEVTCRHDPLKQQGMDPDKIRTEWQLQRVDNYRTWVICQIIEETIPLPMSYQSLANAGSTNAVQKLCQDSVQMMGRAAIHEKERLESLWETLLQHTQQARRLDKNSDISPALGNSETSHHERGPRRTNGSAPPELVVDWDAELAEKDFQALLKEFKEGISTAPNPVVTTSVPPAKMDLGPEKKEKNNFVMGASQKVHFGLDTYTFTTRQKRLAGLIASAAAPLLFKAAWAGFDLLAGLLSSEPDSDNRSENYGQQLAQLTSTVEEHSTKVNALYLGRRFLSERIDEIEFMQEKLRATVTITETSLYLLVLILQRRTAVREIRDLQDQLLTKAEKVVQDLTAQRTPPELLEHRDMRDIEISLLKRQGFLLDRTPERIVSVINPLSLTDGDYGFEVFTQYNAISKPTPIWEIIGMPRTLPSGERVMVKPTPKYYALVRHRPDFILPLTEMEMHVCGQGPCTISQSPLRTNAIQCSIQLKTLSLTPEQANCTFEDGAPQDFLQMTEQCLLFATTSKIRMIMRCEGKNDVIEDIIGTGCLAPQQPRCRLDFPALSKSYTAPPVITQMDSVDANSVGRTMVSVANQSTAIIRKWVVKSRNPIKRIRERFTSTMWWWKNTAVFIATVILTFACFVCAGLIYTKCWMRRAKSYIQALVGLVPENITPGNPLEKFRQRLLPTQQAIAPEHKAPMARIRRLPASPNSIVEQFSERAARIRTMGSQLNRSRRQLCNSLIFQLRQQPPRGTRPDPEAEGQAEGVEMHDYDEGGFTVQKDPRKSGQYRNFQADLEQLDQLRVELPGSGDESQQRSMWPLGITDSRSPLETSPTPSDPSTGPPVPDKPDEFRRALVAHRGQVSTWRNNDDVDPRSVPLYSNGTSEARVIEDKLISTANTNYTAQTPVNPHFHPGSERARRGHFRAQREVLQRSLVFPPLPLPPPPPPLLQMVELDKKDAPRPLRSILEEERQATDASLFYAHYQPSAPAASVSSGGTLTQLITVCRDEPSIRPSMIRRVQEGRRQSGEIESAAEAGATETVRDPSRQGQPGPLER